MEALCTSVDVVRIRKANIVRDREAAMERIAGYTDKEFKRRFRMFRYQFDLLVDTIRTKLEPQSAFAKQCAINSSGSWVRAELKLAATLRVLAGGSYMDAAELYAIEESSFHKNTFWPTIVAICNSTAPCLDNVLFPFNGFDSACCFALYSCCCLPALKYIFCLLLLPSPSTICDTSTDEDALRKHEGTFSRFQKHFPGTVAAGDGCAFRIKRPSEREVEGDVQSHYTRKYSWAYGFVLFCDGDLNIMSIEASHVASTHDAGMYATSGVHEAIEQKELPSWAHVVLDEAFGCTDQELVAWSQGKNALSQEKDAFNYYLSAQRQSVERVFGVLHNRWGILWRPMGFSFDRYKFILVALSRFVCVARSFTTHM